MSIVGAARAGGPADGTEPAGGRDSVDYQRGRAEGTVWAREYATHDELRDLVEEFEPGQSAPFGADHSLQRFMNAGEGKSAAHVPHDGTPFWPHDDTPFWRGFAAGAREVLDELSPLG